MQLDGHRFAFCAVAEHEIDHRFGGLLVAHAGVVETRGADGTAGLRAPDQDARVGERARQVVAQPRGIRCFEPSPDAVRRRREQDVGPASDDRVGIGRELRVILRGGHSDGGGVQYLSTPALERGDQVFGAPVGGDADPEPLELVRPEGGRIHIARVRRGGTIGHSFSVVVGAGGVGRSENASPRGERRRAGVPRRRHLRRVATSVRPHRRRAQHRREGVQPLGSGATPDKSDMPGAGCRGRRSCVSQV